MKVDIECHKCKKEFEAEWDVRGKCPHCKNKYDWAWDGEIWSDTEICLPIFESESEGVKNSFLLVRDWV
jgi:Zn finger protein HypA/HybF involved in hydrogenase expression